MKAFSQVWDPSSSASFVSFGTRGSNCLNPPFVPIDLRDDPGGLAGVAQQLQQLVPGDDAKLAEVGGLRKGVPHQDHMLRQHDHDLANALRRTSRRRRMTCRRRARLIRGQLGCRRLRAGPIGEPDEHDGQEHQDRRRVLPARAGRRLLHFANASLDKARARGHAGREHRALAERGMLDDFEQCLAVVPAFVRARWRRTQASQASSRSACHERFASQQKGLNQWMAVSPRSIQPIQQSPVRRCRISCSRMNRSDGRSIRSVASESNSVGRHNPATAGPKVPGTRLRAGRAARPHSRRHSSARDNTRSSRTASHDPMMRSSRQAPTA